MTARRPRPTPWAPRYFRFLLLAGAIAAFLPPAGQAAPARIPDSVCIECHTGANLDSAVVRGKKVKLDIDRAVLQGSAHAKLACVDCHVGLNPEEQPHRARSTPVACGRCHAAADSAHVFHAKTTFAKSASAVGSCQGCHGTHDVPAKGAVTTAAGARALDLACARCHKQEVAHFENSAHGRAAARGERSAPTCISCHRLPVTAARDHVGSSRVDLQACKLEYSIVSPK